MRWQFWGLPLVLLSVVLSQEESAEGHVEVDTAHVDRDEPARKPLRNSTHSNNWAVLVSTSRFWFNYRHMANVLSFYRSVKRLGIPDDQIVMMLSDDIACNPRNAFPGSVYNGHEHDLDIYGDDIEVDFRGYEVTVESFIRLLTDRWDSDMPRSKRLNSDANSNVLIYLTGHGGNDFLKFQDAEEIGAWDIADAIGQMWEKRRYKELLFMIDTCEANTMYSKIFSPNVIAVGSSQLSESSYSNYTDNAIGVSLIDRFTSLNLRYLENVSKNSNISLADLFNSYDPDDIHSHPGIRTDLFPDDLETVRITDFFGNVQNVEVDASASEVDLQSISQSNYPLKESSPRSPEKLNASSRETATQENKPLPKNLAILGVLGTAVLLVACSTL